MKIVFAVPLMPYPVDGGAKIRLIRHLTVLSEKHQVAVVTIVRGDAERELVRGLEAFGGVTTIEAPHRRTPLHRIAYRTAYKLMGVIKSWPPDAFYGCPAQFARTVKKKALEWDADVVHYDFWFAALGDLHAQSYRRVVLEHDVEYIRRRRNFENKPGTRAGALKSLWMATERAETMVLKSVDAVLTVTDRDSQEVLSAGARQAICLPTGIDTQTCRPPEHEPTGPGLVYVGAFSHHPNVDAMLWFVNDILPIIQKTQPFTTLTIVGSGPPTKITELAGHRNVTVTGAVPEVGPFIQQAKISVVPLRVGSGIKGKIIEAMAFGRPVITTSIGAEGMGLSHGENVIIADDARSFAAAVIDLLEHPEKAQAIGRAGRALVEERHSQARADEQLLEIYEKTIFGK